MRVSKGAFYKKLPYPFLTIFLTIQAAEENIREAKAKNKPTAIEPIIPVGEIVTERSNTELSSVPRIPVKSRVRSSIVLSRISVNLPLSAAIKEITANPTAIPKPTHKRAVGTVKNPVMRRNSVMIPIIILAAAAKIVQVVLQ